MPAPSSTRTTWKGAITFGLVHIPIALHTAIAETRQKRKLVDKDTGGDVGYRLYDKSTGETVDRDEVVKAVQTASGKGVVISDEELREILPKTAGTIGIEQFVKMTDVPPPFFEKPYLVSPQGKGSGKAYRLLHEVLVKTGRAGIAKMVMHRRQHLALLAPFGDALALVFLRWEDQVRGTAGLPLPGTAHAEGISARELKMGENLVMDLDGPWQPELFTDDFDQKYDQLVKAKEKAGDVLELKSVIAEEIVPAQSADVVDLTELLRKSLRKSPREEARAANDEEPQHHRKAAAKKAPQKARTTSHVSRKKA